MRPVTLLSAAALAATVSLGGCLGKPAPSQKLFVLPTASPAGAGAHAGQFGNRSLGFGPVSIASHLDQEYVAVRLEDTRYEYADSMRWASPVEGLVEERLVEAMTWATGVREVRRFPWPSSNAPDVRLSARLVRFELTPEHTAELTAHWSLWEDGGGEPANSGYFNHQEPVQGSSAAAGVEALDRALLRFAEAMAAEMGG